MTDSPRARHGRGGPRRRAGRCQGGGAAARLWLAAVSLSWLLADTTASELTPIRSSAHDDDPPRLVRYAALPSGGVGGCFAVSLCLCFSLCCPCACVCVCLGRGRVATGSARCRSRHSPACSSFRCRKAQEGPRHGPWWRLVATTSTRLRSLLPASTTVCHIGQVFSCLHSLPPILTYRVLSA